MNVALAGAHMTAFGERDAWIRDLLVEAGRACLDDAGVAPPSVDHCYVTTSGGSYEHQGGLANLLRDELGLDPAFATTVEQTSAAGGAGIYEAWQSIHSGESEVTLVVGGETMTHEDTALTTDRVSAITHPVEYKHGVTVPAFAGLTARNYLERFDAPREALAAVAVKNHRNGCANPKAHFQRRVDTETVLSSPIVADPLRLYDFCPISDGAAALLFTTAERARESTGEWVRLDGVGGATGTHVVHEREDPTVMQAVGDAGERAFERTDRALGDVDVLEVHDMFTILELLQLEALGFADHGTAWQLAVNGETARDGRLPVNTSGGLKSKGHPIAASGLAQAVEVYEQLLDRAGDRQVEADVGLACNVGGFANAAVVSLFSSVR